MPRPGGRDSSDSRVSASGGRAASSTQSARSARRTEWRDFDDRRRFESVAGRAQAGRIH